MKLQILSDLHNEFREHVATPLPEVDVVVLAGDIDKGQTGLVWAPFAFPGKQIVFVPRQPRILPS